jgi:hypothetical protein
MSENAQSGRTFVTWSDEHERLAKMVVKKYAGRMGELGISTRFGKNINRSGAVLMALMVAAGETEEKDKE